MNGAFAHLDQTASHQAQARYISFFFLGVERRSLYISPSAFSAHFCHNLPCTYCQHVWNMLLTRDMIPRLDGWMDGWMDIPRSLRLCEQGCDCVKSIILSHLLYS